MNSRLREKQLISTNKQNKNVV